MACESRFHFDWLNALVLKGIAQPVRAARMEMGDEPKVGGDVRL